ncbi:MAG: rod shape-determining protein MreC [Geminicoccaceae bacterium]
MARTEPRVFGIRGPLRALREKGAFGLLVGMTLILVLVGKLDLRLGSAVAGAAGDAAAPILGILQLPVAAGRAAIDGARDLLALREENRRLREENARLQARDAEASWLATENRSLRRMLAVPEVPTAKARLTARIVGDSGGTFVRAVLLDAGSEQGVSLGMPALAPEGLVGRVVDVGRRSSRVLLVTDFNSKVPVVIAGSGDQAILEGDNTPRPRLQFLPMTPGFASGDRVLTSGRGGILPPGLPIGRVDLTADDGRPRVRPLVDWAQLDYVVLLDPVALAEPAPDGSAQAAMASTR